jgi:hypothetical protein
MSNWGIVPPPYLWPELKSGPQQPTDPLWRASMWQRGAEVSRTEAPKSRPVHLTFRGFVYSAGVLEPLSSKLQWSIQAKADFPPLSTNAFSRCFAPGLPALFRPADNKDADLWEMVVSPIAMRMLLGGRQMRSAIEDLFRIGAVVWCQYKWDEWSVAVAGNLRGTKLPRRCSGLKH